MPVDAENPEGAPAPQRSKSFRRGRRFVTLLTVNYAGDEITNVVAAVVAAAAENDDDENDDRNPHFRSTHSPRNTENTSATHHGGAMKKRHFSRKAQSKHADASHKGRSRDDRRARSFSESGEYDQQMVGASFASTTPTKKGSPSGPGATHTAPSRARPPLIHFGYSSAAAPDERHRLPSWAPRAWTNGISPSAPTPMSPYATSPTESPLLAIEMQHVLLE